MSKAILLIALTCSFPPNEQDKTVEFNLGGVRQARAFLTTSKSEYLIRVEMVPIRVFDKATNNLLNHEKARELALIALAKHLSDKEDVELSVSGAETEKIRDEKKSYSLTLRVPISGVSLAKATDKKTQEPTKTTVRIRLNSTLFTRKSDYGTLINRLGTIALAELTKTKSEKVEEKFEDAVSKIKHSALDRLDKLEQAVGADLLLFSMEQAELRQAIFQQKQWLVGKVEETIKNFKTKIQDSDKEKQP